MKQEPAYTIIKYLGGAANVARILHKCKGAVYRVTYSKKRGGANGLFPATYQAKLLNYAKRNDIDLRPDDFFYPERLQDLMQQKDTSPSCEFVDGCVASRAGYEQKDAQQSLGG
ncbi:hypothetical protein [Bartonella sp. WD16.2]|uniref:hypothetical protein n=1 Tax=Bartonella sp. WD16.2 TaxID=1933904 RepID=UPI000999CEB3|nr:hypothetical protein [Bartonella sp. WD16.2]AQX19248.1 hypothetical protein BWD162_001080 [Bartonella sp. WD16.2]